MSKERDEYNLYLRKHKAEQEKKSYSDYLDDSNEAQAEMEQGRENQASDLLLLGAQGASLGYMDELAGGAGALVGKDYEEGRNSVRGKVSGARQRQGIAGDIAETVGSVGTSMAIPVLRGGTAVKEIIGGMIQGAGEAEEIGDIPKSAGIAGTISGATHGLVGGTKKLLFGEPNDILARTAGARGMDFRNAGDSEMKDPAKIAERLDKMGFFKGGDRIFDVNKQKFVVNKMSTKGKIESFVQPQSLEGFLERVQQATSVLGDRNKALLKGKKIPLNEVGQTISDMALDFMPKGENIAKRSETALALAQTIVDDLRARGAIKGNSVDASSIEEVKRFFQDKVAKSYDTQALSDITNEGVEARRTFATELDKLVDKYGGPEYAKNNDLLHDLYSQKKMIHNKSSRQRGYGVEGPALTRPSIGDRVQDAVNTPTIGVNRARVGKFLDTSLGQNIYKGATRLPVEMMSNEDQLSNPAMQGRTPQSLNIPEELIRTPMPRSYDGLMANKSFVLAKVAQMAPEMFEGVKDAYEHDPEMLREIAPVLAQKMPHFFTRDKYNRFDNRILTEMDKQKALKDITSNSSLDSIQQAKLITRLNKEGIYEGQ